MELIALVCPKCGGALTEGHTTKCEWCGTSFIVSKEKSSPKVVVKAQPVQSDEGASPSAEPSDGPTASVSWSISDSLSSSPSPSEPPQPVTVEDYSLWQKLNKKFERLKNL